MTCRYAAVCVIVSRVLRDIAGVPATLWHATCFLQGIKKEVSKKNFEHLSHMRRIRRKHGEFLCQQALTTATTRTTAATTTTATPTVIHSNNNSNNYNNSSNSPVATELTKISFLTLVQLAAPLAHPASRFSLPICPTAPPLSTPIPSLYSLPQPPSPHHPPFPIVIWPNSSSVAFVIPFSSVHLPGQCHGEGGGRSVGCGIEVVGVVRHIV